MRYSGIDEAGYGPLIGPLSVVGVAVESPDEKSLRREFRKAATGAKDSKQVHTPGDISGIEAVALPALSWFCGRQPATAAECFALVGESPESHAQFPWLAEKMDALALPIGPAVSPWQVRTLRPLGLSARIVHVPEYNATLAQGRNKADLELGAVGGILQALDAHGLDAEVTVDRLGGRRYYRDFLQSQWPQAMVMIECEEAIISSYQVLSAGAQQQVRFCVDGESQSILTAIASCIAKYIRELHMLVLNQYFCILYPPLKATAGYVLDGRRWLDELCPSALALHRNLLVRNGMDGRADERMAPTMVPIAEEQVKNAPLALGSTAG